MIDRIGHINICTPDLEETLSFYEKLMGLRRGTALALPGPENAWLFADNGRAIIHVNVEPVDGRPIAEPGINNRIHHVAFDCRDYDKAIANLEELGVPYMRHETALPGLFLITTKDPNGIVVELSFGVDSAIDETKMAVAN